MNYIFYFDGFKSGIFIGGGEVSAKWNRNLETIGCDKAFSNRSIPGNLYQFV